MQLTLTAILYATFLWWFSTGIIFYLNARSPQTFRLSMLAGTGLLLAALYGIWFSAALESIAGVFIAFTCGLVIWGWHTMSYYMGIITGPRRLACPPDCQGGQRFLHALATSLYHELAIIATVILIAWLIRGQPNPIGLWTFILLWAMHVSAKLNVFLGVRNLNVEFIPQRLAYLTTYFRARPMNLLFPFSVTAGTLITILLIQQANAAAAGSASAVGLILLASLAALAVIEHWFMMLPIRAEALWRWSLKTALIEHPAASACLARAATARTSRPASNPADGMKPGTGSASS